MTDIIFISIFRLSGAYVGVLTGDGWFFDAEGRYLGWYDEKQQVWNRDGSFLGEIVNQHYILKRENDWRKNLKMTPKVPPVRPDLPSSPPGRLAVNPEPGWNDALVNVLRFPVDTELFGHWSFGEDWIIFDQERRYTLTVNGMTAESGNWKLSGALILSPEGDDVSETGQIIYQIINYVPGEMTLRQQTPAGRSLPFTIIRK
jgi:hypothetical protein